MFVNHLNLCKDLKQLLDQKSGETWRAVDARTRTPRWPAGLLQVIVTMLVMEQAYLHLRRDMARSLAKLEGELARVGSWAATRRERQEAARYDLAGIWLVR